MKIRRLSRFTVGNPPRKAEPPLTYNSVAIDVSVEELEWLIRNHNKGNGHGIAAPTVGKSVYSLHIVPLDRPFTLPEFD